MNELSVRQLSASETLVRGLLHHDTTPPHLPKKPSSPQNPPRCTSSQCEQGGGDRLHITNKNQLPTAHTSVSAVGATTHHGSLVHLHMADTKVLHVQTLRLTVGLQVVQKHQEELAGSLGPSALISRSLDGVSLGVTTNTAVEAGEGDSLLVGNHVVKVLLGLEQRHVLDGSTHLVSVLEVHSQVRTAGLAAYT